VTEVHVTANLVFTQMFSNEKHTSRTMLLLPKGELTGRMSTE